MRTLSSALVLILAPAAFADDPPNFLELCWRIGPDGAVVVWPDERLTEDNADFTPLFPAVVIREDFLSGTEIGVLALSAGDLLSATDAEYHFRKLRLGTEEELLVARVSAYGERYATDGDGPLFRRAALDRLLGFRLAESRKSDWLKTLCERILTGKGAFGKETTPERDPFLRATAQRTLDRLAGRAAAPPPSLPAEIRSRSKPPSPWIASLR